MRQRGFAALAGGVLLAWRSVAVAAAPLLPPPEGLEARAVARRAEDALRSRTTYAEAEMTIVSPRLPRPRRLRLRWWDDRPGHRAFIRILSPAKDEGTGFLKLGSNLWMYVPRVERTMRIPPSLMLQPWMGSDFTHDDLVRESSALDDYDHRWLGIDPAPPLAPGRRAYVIEYLPHEDAPVVWGKIVAWIDAERGTPLRQEFYDEEGQLVRILSFSDVRQVQGRWFPFRWEMTPLDKPGHRTTIEVRAIRFDLPLEDSLFTPQHLQHWR